MALEKSNTRSMIITSTASAITGVCKWVLSNLESNNFTQMDIFAVHLSLEEAFINAVKHGNKMDPTKEVRIDYSVSADKVEVSMTDEGLGFDPSAVPDPRCGENVYKTEGRGLLLMNAYMDEVEYNETGNSVRMVRYKDKSRPAEEQN